MSILKEIFEWLVMPFGRCNAPVTLQYLMKKVLSPYPSFAAGLFDDDTGWGDTGKEFQTQSVIILKLFIPNGLLLITLKFHLFVMSGVFLGLVISEGYKAVDPEKVTATLNRSMLSTNSKIRGFRSAVSHFKSLKTFISLLIH